MSVWIDPDNITLINEGILVQRDTAKPGADGEHDDLFSVDGGRVLLKGFYGEVTVAIPAASIDFDVHFDPDDGGSDVVLATALVCDSDPSGTFYTLNTTAGGALVQSTDVAYNAILESPILLEEGDIVLGTTGGGTLGTDARVKWDAIYVPIDSGATLTASASSPA